jgi:hypothetical protein
LDVVSVLVAVFEKVASPVSRRLKHPDFEVDRVEHRGYKMVDEQRRTVNLAIVLRNIGRADAANWRAELRGVGLGLVKTSDARLYRANGGSVVEWQSVEPVPTTHTRTVVCELSLGKHAELDLTVSAPYMKPVHRRVVVDWHGPEPVFSAS